LFRYIYFWLLDLVVGWLNPALGWKITILGWLKSHFPSVKILLLSQNAVVGDKKHK
jgi:hypothetical protein